MWHENGGRHFCYYQQDRNSACGDAGWAPTGTTHSRFSPLVVRTTLPDFSKPCVMAKEWR